MGQNITQDVLFMSTIETIDGAKAAFADTTARHLGLEEWATLVGKLRELGAKGVSMNEWLAISVERRKLDVMLTTARRALENADKALGEAVSASVDEHLCSKANLGQQAAVARATVENTFLLIERRLLEHKYYREATETSLDGLSRMLPHLKSK